MGDIVNVAFPHVTDPELPDPKITSFTLKAKTTKGGKWSVTISDVPEMDPGRLSSAISRFLMSIAAGLTHVTEGQNGMVSNISFYEDGYVTWNGQYPQDENEKNWFRESLEVIMKEENQNA